MGWDLHMPFFKCEIRASRAVVSSLWFLGLRFKLLELVAGVFIL